MKTEKEANTARATVDFVCPTWNNTEILRNFMHSFLRNTMEPFRLVIINNGSPFQFAYGSHDYYALKDPRVIVLQMDENKGWMGGVNAGVKWCLENNPAKFIGWINDDVQILDHDCGWLNKMLRAFEKPGVGAVGPVSNAVMGYQHTRHIGLPPYVETTMLSGMCFVAKREVVESVGPLDESLPGGDDLDYSIRVRKAGYKLAICRRTFMLHWYASTGKRVFGDYWDSREHSDAINAALIQKHGFINWYATVNGLFADEGKGQDYIAAEENLALRELSEELKSGKVIDLGCGGKKIHKNAIGVDIRPEGDMGVGCNALIPSSGELSANAGEHIPLADGSVDGILAKHLLEHILDVPKALREWKRVLKDDGRLVIIVPDWRYCEAVSCDPSHVHAFTPESLRSLVETVGGFEITCVENVDPGYVFMISARKRPVGLWREKCAIKQGVAA